MSSLRQIIKDLLNGDALVIGPRRILNAHGVTVVLHTADTAVVRDALIHAGRTLDATSLKPVV